MPRGRKPGYESTQRRFSQPTKVSRIPKQWDALDIDGGLELIVSLLDDAEREARESAERSAKSETSNRFEKMLELARQIRDAVPNSYMESVGVDNDSDI